MNRFAAAAVVSLVMAVPAASQTPEQARAILETTPLVDGHNDLPWALRQRFGSDVHGVDLTQDQSGLAVAAHGHPPPAVRRGGGAVLVRVCARRHGAAGGRPGDLRADRRGQPDAGRLSGRLRFRGHGGRCGASPSGGPHRVADRHRGRILHRGVHGSAAPVLRGGRALHDPDPFGDHQLGRLGHRCAAARRPDALRRSGGARDEPAGHAGGPEPCVRGHHDGRHAGVRGAGDLLPLLGPRRDPTTRAMCPTACCA